MTVDVKRRLHFWYGICLSVLTVVVGILFISQAADIYYSGLGYSRELVIERCTAIAAPFWIWIIAIIAGGIIWIIYPEDKKKLKRLPDERGDVERLLNLAAKQSDSPEYVQAAAAVAREKKVRRIVWISCMAICLICAGVSLYFLFNFSAYPPVKETNEAVNPSANETNEAVLEAVLNLVRSVLPCAAVAFAATCGATIFDGVSAKKILPQAKIMLAKGGRAQAADCGNGKIAAVLQSPITLWCVRGAIFVIAVVFIVIGVFNGGMADVLGKAINICSECIGLG